MFRKNRRQSSIPPSTDCSTDPGAPRFSLISAVSKLSQSDSKEVQEAAFSVGSSKRSGFFSRMFSKKTTSDPVQVPLDPTLHRKSSIWQRGKSFLRSKRASIHMDDSVSTIELQRVAPPKGQLPKLKLKGSGSATRLDFAGFVLDRPAAVAVDTDALLQRMFELNEAAYQQLRSTKLSKEGESERIENEVIESKQLESEVMQLEALPSQIANESENVLSPVLTAVSLENLEQKPSVIEEALEVAKSFVNEGIINEGITNEGFINEGLKHHFHDNPQLDSPLLSSSSQTFSSLNEEEDEDMTEGIPESYSLDEMVEMFGLLDVKQPVQLSNGSLHYQITDSSGSHQSITFEDWRESTGVSEIQEQTAKSLDQLPRSTEETPNFKKAQSFSALPTSKQPEMPNRRSLGSRIAQLVAMFESCAN